LIVVGAVVASAVSAAPSAREGVLAVPSVPHLSEAPDVASAVHAARAQGSRVEVVGERTGTRTVYANPDGTETAEVTAASIRTKVGNEWRPFDTTLTARQDGRVAPNAAEGGVSFSGGGASAPLAALQDSDRALSLFWPGELPKPELSGNKATYREVLPGADLVMLAERDGLQQHLVVKSREAARNPALVSIRMGLRADGLRVSIDDSGAVHAVDDAGAKVFSGPPSTMWDSAGHTAKIGVSVVDGTLILAPDMAFLADPAVAYPVTIDPTFKSVTGWWATVMSGKPDDRALVNRSADPIRPDLIQLGQCNNLNGDCNGIGEVQTYFGFDTSFMHDKLVVEGPAFRSTVVYSPSCAERDHVLYGIQGALPDPMTWRNKPQGLFIGRFVARAAWPNSSCDGAKGVGLHLGAHYSPSGASVYALRAADGNDQLAWRRYNPLETVWTVTYNRAPHSPSNLTTDPPLPQTPCRWCADVPYVSDSNIRLIATLSDPDDDQVYPAWRIQISGEGLIVREDPLGKKASRLPHSTDVTLTDAHHGKTVAWWVHALDGHAGSSPSYGRSFMVDRQAPSVAPTVDSAEYPSDNLWHGAADSPGRFTFSPGKPCDAQNTFGTCDIDRYVYGWTDGLSPTSPSVDANALGGSASVTIAPPGDGPRTLYVRSVDRAGNLSKDTQRYLIRVRHGNGPKSQWSLESNANDTAYLGDRHATLAGNSSYGPGAVGTGLHFDGASGSELTAPNTVRTDASFSVSTWVILKPGRADTGWYTVISQDGSVVPGFSLLYQGNVKTWGFGMARTNVAGSPVDNIVASALAVADTWTHLAATYDGPTRLMTMYVNGEQVQTTVTHQTPWNATGRVRVGSNLPGAIDELLLYDRVLSPSDIRSILSRDNVQIGHWKFDEKIGTTANNSVEGGDAGRLVGNAKFIDRGLVSGSVALDGGGDHVVTSRPAVRTDQSFTVAAWVQANALPGAGGSMTALSQEGGANSGFYLQYNGDRQQWAFVRLGSNLADPVPAWYASLSSEAKVTGAPIHLAGTFNATTKEMILYVNGKPGQVAVLPNAPWDASGPLNIGRHKYRGSYGGDWNGLIDEVRVYNRVLGPQEIVGIVTRNDVPVASWKLDGNANDETGNGMNGTPVNNPAWTAGHSTHPDPADQAINLDGDDYVKAGPVVDTTQSYSVSAWVRLGIQSDGWQTIAVQAGRQETGQPTGNTVAFNLGYSGKSGNGSDQVERWAFQINGPDQINPHNTRVSSDVVAQVGVWTHLAAVFQSSSREMWLYVNGKQAGYARIPDNKPTFNAQGEFNVGRGMWNRSWGANFTGAVDDVKIYGRALFAEEARVLAGRDLSLVHNWRLDESTGTAAADQVGGRPATLTGGAAREAGRVGNAVRFNGVDGAASTTGMDLATDKSFTVSAWVKIDHPGQNPPQRQVTAVSVDGGQTSTYSKFRLGHRIDGDQAINGKWIFDMPLRDGSIEDAAIPVKDSEFGKWVFLVGVYDQPAGDLWLYVFSDGIDPDFDRGTLSEPWNAHGGKAWLGRDRRNGAAAGFWPGAIDDVRFYHGNLGTDRLSALHRSYPASTPPPAR
jgi:hypothetical protein